MSSDLETEAPETAAPTAEEARQATIEKRNKFLGLALGAFVILFTLISYYRISALSP